MQPSETHSPEALSLANVTLARLEEAMATGQNQCLPELMEIIHALSAKATEISVEQLADLIEKHVAVMARVITAANTFGYNPGGADITTVRDAIQVIGFDRIRSLVTSLILVRHAANSEGAKDQRTTALLAVSSGLVARSMAREHDLADPELAFVSASLRQLGRLLLASYLPDEYKEAMLLAATMTEEHAFVEKFGLTSLALTREILTRARFPSRLLDTLHEHPPKTAHRRSTEAQSLITLSAYSERLCSLAIDRTRDEEQFAHSLQSLSTVFGNRFKFSKEQMEGTLASMVDTLSHFTGSMGFGSVAQDVVNTVRWRAGTGPSNAFPKTKTATESASTKLSSLSDQKTKTDTADKGPALTAQPSAPKPTASSVTTPGSEASPKAPPAFPASDTSKDTASSHASLAPLTPDEAALKEKEDSIAELEVRTKHWRDGLVSLTSFLSENTIDMSSVYSLAMDFVRQGFSAPEAIMLSVEPDQRSYVATNGVGPVFKRIRGDKAVRREERTVFGIALTRRENVVIHNTGDAKIAPYLPAWASSLGGWGAFVAIPICDQTFCFSLLIIAWPKPHHIVISADNSKLLRSLLGTVSAARKLSSF